MPRFFCLTASGQLLWALSRWAMVAFSVPLFACTSYVEPSEAAGWNPGVPRGHIQDANNKIHEWPRWRCIERACESAIAVGTPRGGFSGLLDTTEAEAQLQTDRKQAHCYERDSNVEAQMPRDPGRRTRIVPSRSMMQAQGCRLRATTARMDDKNRSSWTTYLP